MVFKMETNLILPGGAVKLADQAPATGPAIPGNPQVAMPANVAAPVVASASGPMVATIVKSWTSRGNAVTGKDLVRIEASYPAVRNPVNGAVSLGSSTFTLTVTDLDNQTSSIVSDYAFSDFGWMDIPTPESGAPFTISGRFRIEFLSTGKWLHVEIAMGPGFAMNERGNVFQLDIPADTTFTALPPSLPSSS